MAVATKRVANHQTNDRLKYCLAEPGSGWGVLGAVDEVTCEGGGGAWISAQHATHAIHHLVDVVGLTMVAHPSSDTSSSSSSSSSSSQPTNGKDHPLIAHEQGPEDKDEDEDALSLRMAGAMALTFLEKNIIKLVSTYCSQFRAHHSIKLPPSLHAYKQSDRDQNRTSPGEHVAEVLQTAPVFLRPVQAVVPGIFRAMQAMIGGGLTYKGYQGNKDASSINAAGAGTGTPLTATCLAGGDNSVDSGTSTFYESPVYHAQFTNLPTSTCPVYLTLLGLFYGFIHAMRLCATTCTMYSGGQSSANELMLLHLLLHNEEENPDSCSSGTPGVDVKQGGLDSSDDLLDKLLTGTLVAFELCLPSAVNLSNPQSDPQSHPASGTPAAESVTPTPTPTSSSLKDLEEMRCVAFRSLCNLSDCDSADALGNPRHTAIS